MLMSRRILPFVLALVVAACGKDGSPAQPTPQPQTPTRIVAVAGSLNFGDVGIGEFVDRQFTITNSGNEALSVTSITGPAGGAFATSFPNGSVPAGGTVSVNVRFAPTEVRSYSGTMTVVGNHTAGTNTLPITAGGIRTGPLVTRNGVGNFVFDLPYAMRARVTGRTPSNCQNFAMRRVGGSLVVNVILGTCSVADVREYDGVHQLAAGTYEVVISEGVQWTVTEVR